MTSLRAAGGFTIVEMLVASALTMAVAAGTFTLLVPAQNAFLTQPEAADVQQRLRVGIDTLTRELQMAELVLPYRIGEVASDALAGLYYRPDTISLVFATAPNVEPRISHTYYPKIDASTDTFQLMHYDGRQAEFPVLDHVVGLAFEYFGGAGPLDPAMLTDGPWLPDASHPERFDADLLRVRRVHVRMRTQARAPFRGPAGTLFARGGAATTVQRYVPDQEIRFDVSPRNTGLGP